MVPEAIALTHDRMFPRNPRGRTIRTEKVVPGEQAAAVNSTDRQ